MTTAYIPSAKDAHTMKHSTTCDTCGKTVTSGSAGGLRRTGDGWGVVRVGGWGSEQNGE